jgi:hypothetical protein
MSARRTKRNRVKAQSKRLTEKSATSSSSKEIKTDAQDLLHYDTSLIVKDLSKTLIATMIVVGMLVALYIKF